MFLFFVFFKFTEAGFSGHLLHFWTKNTFLEALDEGASDVCGPQLSFCVVSFEIFGLKKSGYANYSS